MKAAAVVFAVGSALAYGYIGARRAWQEGATWRERAARLVAAREPAMYLDAARVLALLAWMRNVPDLALTGEHLRRGTAWIAPVGIFTWVRVHTVPPGALPVAVWAMRAALLLAILGVGARGAMAVAAVLHALLWSVAYSTIGSSVHNHAVFFLLLGLALAPQRYVPIWRYAAAWKKGEPLAQVGTYPVFVRWAAIASVCTVYMQPGIEKVLRGGLAWFNGVTMAGHALRQGQLSTPLASLPIEALAALGLAVVLWETGFGLVLFFPRLRWAAAVSAWAFHEFVRRGMGITQFFFMEAALLFVLTPREIWETLARKARVRVDAGESAPAPSRPEWVSAALMGALLALSWVPTLVRRDFYPVSSNSMFPSALERGSLVPARGHLVVRDAAGTRREVRCEDAIAMHWEACTELLFTRYLAPVPLFAPESASRDDYCRDILGRIVAGAAPDAVELEMSVDLFVVPDPVWQRRVVHTCRAAGGPP